MEFTQNNLYLVSLDNDYYVSIAEQLSSFGYNIKVIGSVRSDSQYWPAKLNQFLAKYSPKVLYFDDYHGPIQFEKVFDPDYSIFDLQLSHELLYYEKLFLMTTDRLCFNPIAQIDRHRLFYRFIAHFYNIFKINSIGSIVLFGTPHGLLSLAVFAVAKTLGLNIIYTEWSLLSPALSTIENDLQVRRHYSDAQLRIAKTCHPEDINSIKSIVIQRVNQEMFWNTGVHLNITKSIFTRITHILMTPFKKYTAPEFFFEDPNTPRIKYVLPLLSFYIKTLRTIHFYNSNVTEELPDQESMVLFLHQQPEATTMPLGGIFSDQLLVVDLLLKALPTTTKLFIKEHPHMFEYPAQDVHERSISFYKHILKDSRVRLLKQNVNSGLLIERSKYIVSVCGSACWEAIRLGKPSIVFGYSWYGECDSCFEVDSVDTIKKAIKSINSLTYQEVIKDLSKFISNLQGRLINAASCKGAFEYLPPNYNKQKAALIISKAIDYSLRSK